MRFLKIILSVFALFYRLTPNYLIISDVYFLHRHFMPRSDTVFQLFILLCSIVSLCFYIQLTAQNYGFS